MKQLILITAMLLAMVTKMVAQEKGAVEIKNVKTETHQVTKENHQFDIVAHEEVAVYLKLNLKEEDNLNVVVKDDNDHVVLRKEFKKKGENRLDFTMEEKEKYTVTLIGEKPSNLVVSMTQN